MPEAEVSRKENIVIGTWVSEKKGNSAFFESLVQYLRDHGQQVVRLDLSRPIEEQGNFDVIIHKNLGGFRNKEGQAQMQRLESYSKANPKCLILDPPSGIDKILSRMKTMEALKDLNISDESGTIRSPLTILVTEVTDTRNFPFPGVAKPLQADGSPDCHKLALVYNCDGLKSIPRPFVLQQFVNHDELLHKIYAIGDKFMIGVRNSLPNVDKPSETHDLEYFGRISREVTNENTQTQPKNQPSENLVRLLCNKIHEILGLSLFGLDVITKVNTQEHYVIDINYFPSYAGLPDVNLIFNEYIIQKVNQLRSTP